MKTMSRIHGQLGKLEHLLCALLLSPPACGKSKGTQRKVNQYHGTSIAQTTAVVDDDRGHFIRREGQRVNLRIRAPLRKKM